MNRYLFSLYLLCQGLQLIAQNDKVQLLNANSLEYDVKASGKVKRLIGDVRFKHNNTLLFCDSAWQFDEENRVESFGRVHIINQDSIHLYGDRMVYDGHSRHATLTGNARMTDGDMNLSSPSLEYDMKSNYGYYTGGGKIVNGEVTLTSKNGYYYAASKETYFRTNVVLVHPDYTLNTDTLKYNTLTRMADMLGPTRIISNQDQMYTTRGKYDTRRSIAMFGKQAIVQSKGNYLTADSIYFEKVPQYGRSYRNIELYDTSSQVIVYGNFGELKGKSDETLVTRDAVAKQYTDNDSLFIFADTIWSMRKKDSKPLVRAWHHVKLIKTDMQSICDSMIFDRADSAITLYGSPVLWTGSNQITADTIRLFLINNELDSFTITGNAFLISRESAEMFNQIKGRQMYGRFEGNKIRFLHVNGNGQSIYYAKEDSAYTGVNVNECSEMEFYFEDNKIKRSNFINRPTAVFHAMERLKFDEYKLRGFQWLSGLRPTRQLISKRFYNKRLFFKKNFK